MQGETLKNFTLGYFELLGGSVEEVSFDLYRVELSPEQAAQLEPNNPFLWMGSPGAGAARSPITYYFTFTPSVAERTEGAELIGAGSHRLQQVVESVRRLGEATRLWVPVPRSAPTGPLVYRPFYCFLIRLNYRVPRMRSRLVPVAVDRVDHLPLRQLAALLPSLPLRSGAPDAAIYEVEPASLTVEDAFLLAYEEVVEGLASEDPSWARDALAALEQERERLERYYEERRREGESVEPERTHRLEELEALKPWVYVRLQAAAEVFLPLAYDRGTLRHIAFSHPVSR